MARGSETALLAGSAEQAAADEIALGMRARRNEEIAAAHGRDVVGHRLVIEALLDDDELPAGTLVEGHEQETLIELAGGVEGAGMGGAGMGGEGDSPAVGIKVVPRILELSRPAERRPGVTRPTDHGLLLA